MEYFVVCTTQINFTQRKMFLGKWNSDNSYYLYEQIKALFCEATGAAVFIGEGWSAVPPQGKPRSPCWDRGHGWAPCSRPEPGLFLGWRCPGADLPRWTLLQPVPGPGRDPRDCPRPCCKTWMGSGMLQDKLSPLQLQWRAPSVPSYFSEAFLLLW